MRLRDGPHITDRDPVTVIRAALDAGITMIDTADAYQNEELVGRAVHGCRAEAALASKFGLVWSGKVAGDFEVRADPAYVRRACEASLRRLGVEKIDLYYLHHRSESTPIEDTVAAMAGLVAEGKIGALGLSNVTPDDLRRAHAEQHAATAAGLRLSTDELQRLDSATAPGLRSNGDHLRCERAIHRGPSGSDRAPGRRHRGRDVAAPVPARPAGGGPGRGRGGRAAWLATRSIKKASKLAAIDLAISMVDLTTLEGADTPGKVRNLARKAMLPDPDRPDTPHTAAVCVYPDMVAVARTN